MESFSMTAYSAQLRMYSGSADPPKPKLRDTSSETSFEPRSHSCDFKNKDGDSFSLSLEARIVQISISSSDDGAASGDQGTKGLEGSGALSKVSEEDRLFGSGMVKALMEVLGEILKHEGDNRDKGEEDKARQAESPNFRSHGHKHRHHHRRMDDSYLT